MYRYLCINHLYAIKLVIKIFNHLHKNSKQESHKHKERLFREQRRVSLYIKANKVHISERYHLNTFSRLQAKLPPGFVPASSLQQELLPSPTPMMISRMNDHQYTWKQGFPMQDGGSAESTKDFRPGLRGKSQHNNLALFSLSLRPSL